MVLTSTYQHIHHRQQQQQQKHQGTEQSNMESPVEGEEQCLIYHWTKVYYESIRTNLQS